MTRGRAVGARAARPPAARHGPIFPTRPWRARARDRRAMGADDRCRSDRPRGGRSSDSETTDRQRVREPAPGSRRARPCARTSIHPRNRARRPAHSTPASYNRLASAAPPPAPGSPSGLPGDTVSAPIRTEVGRRLHVSLRDGFDYITDPGNWPELSPGSSGSNLRRAGASPATERLSYCACLAARLKST
jgi:hypothetical protein